MSLPIDTPTVTLTYGAHTNSAKEPLLSGTMYVIPQLARTHIASGSYIDKSAVATDLSGGVASAEPVVASDAAGFNVAGLVLYTIKFAGLVAADGSSIERAALINVALPGSVPVVDVDELASTETEAGVVVSYPSVIDVAGASGSISGAELMAAIDTELTTKIGTALEGFVSQDEFTEAVDLAVGDAAEVQMAGVELDYTERITTFTSTSTATPGTAIAGLSSTIVGNGRAVVVEFEALQVFHSVANTAVVFVLVIAVNGGAAAPFFFGIKRSPATNAGDSATFRKRFVVPNGQTWVCTVGVYGAAAGTCTVSRDSTFPTALSVSSR